MFAHTPAAPYYAVIFTSALSGADPDGYAAAAERMMTLAQAQPGFLGVESARGADGLGITVSYWTDEGAIRAWREHLEHTEAREQGRTLWYEGVFTRVAKVERAYSF